MNATPSIPSAWGRNAGVMANGMAPAAQTGTAAAVPNEVSSADVQQPSDGFTAPSYASASLYIGDLHEDITEPMLYEVFSQPASVASIRICRDSQTQRSLGYAYVNYHTIPDAERAMDVLNFSLIKDRPCRIMWVNRDKNARAKSENNVFVKNLDRTIDHRSLYDTFSLFGQILSCKVVTDLQGKSLGYGYVQYEKEQSLLDAIKRVNGMRIGNNIVYCGRHKRREERQSLREEKFTNIYVKGYDPEKCSSEKVKAMLEEVGTITSFVSKVDDKGRESMFINFENFEAAKEAISKFNNRRFSDGGDLLSIKETEKLDEEDTAAKEGGTYPEDASTPRRLYVTRHQSRAERDEKLKQAFSPKPSTSEPQPTVLYTRHFPLTYTDEDLKALFEPYGIVTSAKVARNESGVSKGFGFVTFPESQDAQKAITGLHETNIGGDTSGSKLYVTYLEHREQRQTRLKAQMADSMWRPNTQQYPSYRAAAMAPGSSRYPPPNMVPHRMGYPAMRGQNPRGHRAGARGRYGHDGSMSMDPTMVNDPINNVNVTYKDQKQMIGDRLYHFIMGHHPALAGKITGMMLEMPNEDLLNLLQRPDDLAVKIDEAIDVLKQAGGPGRVSDQ